MKTPTLYIKRCLLVVALLTASALSVQATDTFKARVRTTAQQTMNISLSASDTIPLSNLGTIYALSIDAIITQPREASFVRIVLEDVEGHNYLIAESDRFRNDTTTVNLSEYCEETAQLNGITPLRLKCYLTHASLQLTGIYTSTEMPTRGMATEQELRAMKEAQVQDIVDRINEYNVRHGKLWQAAATPYALRSAESQGTIGADDPYLANMKYYAGGLYEIGERNRQATTYNSPYAESFDWSQTRHGKMWITPVKNQGEHGPCMIYAAVGVAEALTNLYFNDTINLVLSEFYIRKCTYFDQTSQYVDLNVPVHSVPMNFIATDGVIDSLSAVNPTPYWNPGVNNPIGVELIKFTDVIEINPTGLSRDAFNDSIKKHIIHNGPGVWGSQFPNNPNSYSNHYMALVGYGTTKIGDQHYIITSNSNNIITIDASMAGKTFWKFKNSYGPSAPQYMTLVFNDDAYLYPAYFAKNPIIRRDHNSSEIICEDRDGDGYFNWGISENPPIALPAWAFQEKDADDSDCSIGQLYENGDVETVSIDYVPHNIYGIESINNATFNRKDICVKSGGKLVVQNELRCLPGVLLKVESGGTLEINGGKVVNVIFDIQAGGTLKIDNHGQLIPVSDGMNDTYLNIPLGAILQFYKGSIQKSSVEFYQP